MTSTHERISHPSATNLPTYQQVLEKLPAGAYACDAAGLITYYNEAAVALWGRAPALNDPADRFCGSFRLYVDGARIRHNECWMARALNDDKGYNGEEIVIERPDGTRVTVLAHANPLHDESGAVIGAVNVLVDITDRKRAEDALHEAERGARTQFERLLDRLPAAAYTCDADGLITYYNGQATTIWGRSPKLNDPADRFCGSFKLYREGAPLNPARSGMAKALRENRGFNGEEIVIERPDGSKVAVLAHANPMHDDHGRIVGAVNVLVDITDRKRAEELLLSMDYRKDLFLSKLAHELRNQLGPTRSVLHVLREGHGGATYDQARGMLQRQIEQMVQLVDNLTDVVQLTQRKLTLRKERIELAGVVRGVLKSAQQRPETADHKLTVTVPKAPIWIEADTIRLPQALNCLLTNALRHTPKSGQVSIGVERAGSHAVIAVKDTGEGISPEELPHLFDMVASMGRSLDRGRTGLGIGLTLVKGIIELHGGLIEARSEGKDRGSEFIVRLPVVA